MKKPSFDTEIKNGKMFIRPSNHREVNKDSVPTNEPNFSNMSASDDKSILLEINASLAKANATLGDLSKRNIFQKQNLRGAKKEKGIPDFNKEYQPLKNSNDDIKNKDSQFSKDKIVLQESEEWESEEDAYDEEEMAELSELIALEMKDNKAFVGTEKGFKKIQQLQDAKNRLLMMIPGGKFGFDGLAALAFRGLLWGPLRRFLFKHRGFFKKWLKFRKELKLLKKNALKNAQKAAKKTAKNIVKTNLDWAAKKAVKEAGEGASKEAIEKAFREILEEKVEKGVKEVTEKSIKETVEKGGKDLGKRFTKKVSDKMVREISEEMSTKYLKKITSDAIKKGAKHAVRLAAKGAKEAAKKAAKAVNMSRKVAKVANTGRKIAKPLMTVAKAAKAAAKFGTSAMIGAAVEIVSTIAFGALFRDRIIEQSIKKTEEMEKEIDEKIMKLLEGYEFKSADEEQKFIKNAASMYAYEYALAYHNKRNSFGKLAMAKAQNLLKSGDDLPVESTADWIAQFLFEEKISWEIEKLTAQRLLQKTGIVKINGQEGSRGFEAALDNQWNQVVLNDRTRRELEIALKNHQETIKKIETFKESQENSEADGAQSDNAEISSEPEEPKMTISHDNGYKGSAPLADLVFPANNSQEVNMPAGSTANITPVVKPNIPKNIEKGSGSSILQVENQEQKPKVFYKSDYSIKSDVENLIKKEAQIKQRASQPQKPQVFNLPSMPKTQTTEKTIIIPRDDMRFFIDEVK